LVLSDTDSNPEVLGSAPKLTVVPEPGSMLLAFTGLGVMMLRRKRTAAR
jgi:PEP-CTERM motif